MYMDVSIEKSKIINNIKGLHLLIMAESYIRILYAIRADFTLFFEVKSTSKSYIKKKYTSRKRTNDLVVVYHW